MMRLSALETFLNHQGIDLIIAVAIMLVDVCEESSGILTSAHAILLQWTPLTSLRCDQVAHSMHAQLNHVAIWVIT